jgi:glycosyltransferase involved in cell wall biosynthesis
MHIALITGEFPPLQGGVGDYTRELARAFARRDQTITIITDGRAKPSEQLPVSSEGLPPPRHSPSCDYAQDKFAIHYTSFASWRCLPHIAQLARGCDLVHIQYQAAAYGLTPPIHLLPRYLHWRNRRSKVYVTFHDLKVPYLFPKAGALRWRALTYLAQSCDGVIVTNQEDLHTLTQIPTFKVQRSMFNGQAATPNRQQRGGALALPMTLIPIGSNIDAQALTTIERHAVRLSWGAQADEALLCYFGFLNASKGGETLIKVLAKVRGAGYNARLLMVGGEIGASDATNRAYAERVKALIRELGVAESIIWTGYQSPPSVSALWRASDIALLPYADGASLRRGTLMAALAHAMPIVSTTPRVSVPQLCHGENILLAPPDDVDALAAQVIQLITTSTLRDRLARGATQLSAEFAWPRIADKHLEFYRAVGKQ